MSIEVAETNCISSQRGACATRDREKVREYGIAIDLKVFNTKRVRNSELISDQPGSADVTNRIRSLGISS